MNSDSDSDSDFDSENYNDSQKTRKKPRCPKGERRKYLPDGKTWRCEPITETDKKTNETRRNKKQVDVENLQNPKRCPSGHRKIFRDKEKTQWDCVPVNDKQKEINEKKKKEYENKKKDEQKVDAYAVIKTVREKPWKEIKIRQELNPINTDYYNSDSENDTDDEWQNAVANIDGPKKPLKKTIMVESFSPTKQSPSPESEREKILQEEKKMFQSKKKDSSGIYPDINRNDFAKKISEKREFANTKYDDQIYNIEERAEQLCHLPVEFHPYQLFVKNFLSPETPYNGMLLYHGLGTGKTITALGVCEQMRHFMRSIGQIKRIYIVAGSIIRQNFKNELFNENLIPDDLSKPWNMDKIPIYMLDILREIHPRLIFKNMTRDLIIRSARKIIKTSYVFVGYQKLAMEIQQSNPMKIQKKFSHTLMVIDEVHNIRYNADTVKEKYQLRNKIGELLMTVVQQTTNMRLLLMSATPVFDSPMEIVRIANLLNANDKRPLLKIKEVFYVQNKNGQEQVENDEENENDKNNDEKTKEDDKAKGRKRKAKGIGSQEIEGDFRKPHKQGNIILEGGYDLLKRKLTGYVSYVRGENPYSFPYRVYPNIFAPHKTFQLGNTENDGTIPYPTQSFDGQPIQNDSRLKYTYLYTDTLQNYQTQIYEKKLEKETKNQFSWISIVQCLNIVFPLKDPTNIDVASCIGDYGFDQCMDEQNVNNDQSQFSYKQNTPHFFEPKLLGQHSAKIAQITHCIENSVGIVLVYSQYLKCGILSVALALEEMGFHRYDAPDLLKNGGGNGVRNQSEWNYLLITGQTPVEKIKKGLRMVTSPENKNGSKIKVILISEAGSEGIDFKNIRQVHILEPWYNLNRMEQVIGRAVRFKSHCALPFQERNVEIYLHTALTNDKKETIDAFIYRVYAETKAIQMGQVNRLLKQTAVDIYLNIGQTKMTWEDFKDQKLSILLSSKADNGKRIEIIDFPVGDRPFTALCDYESTCQYIDKGNWTEIENINDATFRLDHIQKSSQNLIQRIKGLFREYDFLSKNQIIYFCNSGNRQYTIEEIYYVLYYFISHPNELFINKQGEWGHLIVQGNIYLFQPQNNSNFYMTTMERMLPVEKQKGSFILSLDNLSTETISIDDILKEKPALSNFNKLIQKWENILNYLEEKDNEEHETDEDSDRESDQESDTESDLEELDETIDEWYQILVKKISSKSSLLKMKIISLILNLDIFDEKNGNFHEILADHFIDTMNIIDKYTLFYYTVQKTKKTEPFVSYFQKYCRFQTNYFCLYDSNHKKHYFFQNSQWINQDLTTEFLKVKYSAYNNYKNNIVGCIDYNPKEEKYLLKLKDTKTDKKYNTGAFCIQKNGKDLFQMNFSNTFNILNHFKDTFQPILTKSENCVLVEVFLRLLNQLDKPTLYFLSPEEFSVV